MTVYKIARTSNFTEYYLVQVEHEKQTEDGTVTELIKGDAFAPYYTESEHNDGDLAWEECTEEEAREIEKAQGITREIVEEDKEGGPPQFEVFLVKSATEVRELCREHRGYPHPDFDIDEYPLEAQGKSSHSFICKCMNSDDVYLCFYAETYEQAHAIWEEL
jgi:hypothetical protein